LGKPKKIKNCEGGKKKAGKNNQMQLKRPGRNVGGEKKIYVVDG